MHLVNSANNMLGYFFRRLVSIYVVQFRFSSNYFLIPVSFFFPRSFFVSAAGIGNLLRGGGVL